MVLMRQMRNVVSVTAAAFTLLLTPAPPVAVAEACPEVEWLPQGLGGLDVVLLQTHTDGIDAEAWGQRWEALLRCAGAHVRRQRYSPAVRLGDYLEPSLAGAAG